jgi:hypothetical protein
MYMYKMQKIKTIEKFQRHEYCIFIVYIQKVNTFFALSANSYCQSLSLILRSHLDLEIVLLGSKDAKLQKIFRGFFFNALCRFSTFQLDMSWK